MNVSSLLAVDHRWSCPCEIHTNGTLRRLATVEVENGQLDRSQGPHTHLPCSLGWTTDVTVEVTRGTPSPETWRRTFQRVTYTDNKNNVIVGVETLPSGLGPGPGGPVGLRLLRTSLTIGLLTLWSCLDGTLSGVSREGVSGVGPRRPSTCVRPSEGTVSGT